jgi:hypothetical protein
MVYHSTAYQLSSNGTSWGNYVLGEWVPDEWVIPPVNPADNGPDKNSEPAGANKTLTLPSLPIGFYYGRLKITSLAPDVVGEVISEVFTFTISTVMNNVYLYQYQASPQTMVLSASRTVEATSSQVQGSQVSTLSATALHEASAAQAQEGQTQLITGTSEVIFTLDTSTLDSTDVLG